MITINKNQLYKKIQSGEYKIAVVFDRFLNSMPSNLPFFERLEAESPEDLITLVKDFVKEYSGNFTFVLRKSIGGNQTGISLVRVDLNGSKEQNYAGVQLQGAQDPEEMKQQLLKEIKAEMRQTQLTAELEMYKSKVTHLETTSGKLGLIFENFLLAKMGNKAPLFQDKLQGTPTGETEISEEDISEKDFTDALITIKDKFGAPLLIKVAEKIKNNDPQIEMLINMFRND